MSNELIPPIKNMKNRIEIHTCAYTKSLHHALGRSIDPIQQISGHIFLRD